MFYKVPQSEQSYTTEVKDCSTQKKFELYCREHDDFTLVYNFCSMEKKVGNYLNSNQIVIDYCIDRSKEVLYNLDAQDLQVTAVNIIESIDNYLEEEE